MRLREDKGFSLIMSGFVMRCQCNHTWCGVHLNSAVYDCSHHQCNAGSKMAINTSGDLAAAEERVCVCIYLLLWKTVYHQAGVFCSTIDWPCLIQVTEMVWTYGVDICWFCHQFMSLGVIQGSSSLFGAWITVRLYGCDVHGLKRKKAKWDSNCFHITGLRVSNEHLPSGTSLSLMCCR